jgi:hypothetical protein
MARFGDRAIPWVMSLERRLYDMRACSSVGWSALGRDSLPRLRIIVSPF